MSINTDTNTETKFYMVVCVSPYSPTIEIETIDTSDGSTKTSTTSQPLYSAITQLHTPIAPRNKHSLKYNYFPASSHNILNDWYVVGTDIEEPMPFIEALEWDTKIKDKKRPELAMQLFKIAQDCNAVVEYENGTTEYWKVYFAQQDVSALLARIKEQN